MDRRSALITLGVVFAALMNRFIPTSRADELSTAQELSVISFDTPVDFYISENSLNNVIIERKNGKKIEIPWTEVVDAIESSNKAN